MSNKTILFADDSATMRFIVEKTFAAEPYAVVSVPSGEGAIAKAKEIKPDIIIVDAGMPGFSGYDVCRAIRKDPVLGDIPVIIMSGVSNLYDEARGRDAGVTEHMKKPFDTGLLIEMASGLVAAKSLAQDVPLEDVEPEEEPFESVSELPLPKSASLSKPIIPLAAKAPQYQTTSSVGAGSMIGRKPADKPVDKHTQEYARPSSPPPMAAHVGKSVSLDAGSYGEEVDFGDEEPIDLSKPEAPSDVPPIELTNRSSEADTGSFHVGTLAELAQMDARGIPLEAETDEDAIELAPTASSLASLGPKMPLESTTGSGTKIDSERGTVSSIPDMPDIPDTEDELEVLPETGLDEDESETVEEADRSIQTAPKFAGVSPTPRGAADAIRNRADIAAEQLTARVEGITPAQAAAIQTLTREIIERVVWEVVPDLAEVIIKEELAKLLKE